MSAARGVAVLLMALALNALEGAKGNEVDYPAKWWKTANCYADSGGTSGRFAKYRISF